MTKYGNIKSYDTSKGSGTIAPEQGGEVLNFGKFDLQQEASTPKSGQRFSYERRKQVDGGMVTATNLRQQEQAVRQNGKQRDQAEQQQG